MAVVFELNGKRFIALDGGPDCKFNEAISIVVNFETQVEIDHYWNKFAEEGQEGKCGWIKVKYGVLWQIIPTTLDKLMSDPEKAPKAMYTFWQMKKIDIEKLTQL